MLGVQDWLRRQRTERAKWGALLFSLAVSAALLAIATRTSPLYPFMDGVDQNCFLTVGKGMMNGLVPYRDLVEQKGPLLYLLHGLAWLLSPDSWLGVWLLEVLALGLYLWWSWRIWGLYGARPWSAAFLPLLGALIVLPTPFVSGDNVEEFCLPLMAAGLYDLLRLLRDYPGNGGHMPARRLVLHGTLAGCVLWMKFTMLGFWFIWMALVFFGLVLRRDWRRALTSCLWFLAGMLGIATLPWVVYFGLNGAIGDWLYVYFYCNIFAYSSEALTLLGRLAYVWRVVAHAAVSQWGLSLSAGAGWLWLLLSRRALPHPFAKVGFTLVLPVTLLGLFGGGMAISYYHLFAYGFALLGFLPFSQALGRLGTWVNGHSRALSSAAGLALSAAVAVGTTAFTLHTSRNAPYIGYDRDALPQYQFAQVIRDLTDTPPGQTPDATLLNYGFLDGGFYMAADILPSTPYFCRLNLRHDRFPAMADEQDRLLREGEVDFAVLRAGSGTEPEAVAASAPLERYTCVAQADEGYLLPGQKPAFTYFLFHRVS